MTTPVPRRSLTGAQAGGSALAGLVQGFALALLAAATGSYTAGGWSAGQPWSDWALLGLAVLLLAASWFASVAVLRRRGTTRPRTVASFSLGLSTAVVAVLAVVVGWAAVLIGAFSALVLWTGQYVDAIAVTAVALVALVAVLVSTAVCVLFAVAFARPRSAPTAVSAPAPLI